MNCFHNRKCNFREKEKNTSIPLEGRRYFPQAHGISFDIVHLSIQPRAQFSLLSPSRLVSNDAWILKLHCPFECLFSHNTPCNFREKEESMLGLCFVLFEHNDAAYTSNCCEYKHKHSSFWSLIEKYINHQHKNQYYTHDNRQYVFHCSHLPQNRMIFMRKQKKEAHVGLPP